jgi:hypothetical protein
MSRRVYSTRAWRAAKGAVDEIGPLGSVMVITVEQSEGGLVVSTGTAIGDKASPAVEQQTAAVWQAVCRSLIRLEAQQAKETVT